MCDETTKPSMPEDDAPPFLTNEESFRKWQEED